MKKLSVVYTPEVFDVIGAIREGSLDAHLDRIRAECSTRKKEKDK